MTKPPNQPASVIDEMRALEARVAQRLAELEPLVDEYRDLRSVAERLGIAPVGRPKKRLKTASRSYIGGARRYEQILDVVRRRPGVSVAELGRELDADPTSLYRVIHRLSGDGLVEKRGRELHPLG